MAHAVLLSKNESGLCLLRVRVRLNHDSTITEPPEPFTGRTPAFFVCAANYERPVCFLPGENLRGSGGVVRVGVGVGAGFCLCFGGEGQCKPSYPLALHMKGCDCTRQGDFN